MILEFAALSRLSGESVFEVFYSSQLMLPHIQVLVAATGTLTF